MSSSSPVVAAPARGPAARRWFFGFSPAAVPSSFVGWFVAVVDALAIQGGCWVERSVRGHDVGLDGWTPLLPMALFVGVGAAIGWYRLPSLVSPFRQVGLVLGGTAVVVLTCFAVAWLGQTEMALLGAGGAMLVVSFGLRPVWGWGLEKLAAGGVVRGKPVVVLGLADELHDLKAPALLLGHGLAEIGRFALTSYADLRDGAALEPIELALEQARRSEARAFIVAACWDRCAAMSPVVRTLQASSLPVFFLPLERQGSGVSVGRRSDLFDLQPAPIGEIGSVLKRLMDITLALLVLVFLAPLLVCVALAVRLDSPGPIIFRQTRSGLDRRPFTIFKFRSMRMVEEGDRLQQAQRGDQRVTRVGRWLRRTSVDELPQLINVVRGEMSLVGPRPHALAHDQVFRGIVEEYNMRHRVKPGITGWAQVGGARGETTQPEQVQRRIALDIWYIHHWSPLLDAKILLRTALDIAFHDAY